MKKNFIILLVITFLISSSSTTFAATEYKNITLPNFTVRINNVEVDNTYREYPLIVCNDITYFPLTYYDCRFLGIGTKWSQNSGLDVYKNGITCGYREYKSVDKNKNTYTATIPDFNININGELINNKEQKYPLLLFRNVTYFPMTWSFCVDEFGWNYSFNRPNGLNIISSNQKTNVVLSKSNYKLVNYKTYTIDDKALYYTDLNGGVYKKSFSNPKNEKKIHQLPENDATYNGKKTYVNCNFKVIDNELYLVYHGGGGMMGTDRHIKINEAGSITASDNMIFKNKGNIKIEVSQVTPPGPNNVILKKEGTTPVRIGNQNYYYGWKLNNNGGWVPSDDLYIVNNNVYLLGLDSDKTDISKIVGINLDSNNTFVVCNSNVANFDIIKNNIYYMDENKYMHKINIKSLEETLIDTSNWGLFEVFESDIYYTDKDGMLHIYGKNQPIIDCTNATNLFTSSEYLVCQYSEIVTNSSRLIIIDKNNNIVFKSSDVASILNISSEGILTYIERNTKNIYQVKL